MGLIMKRCASWGVLLSSLVCLSVVADEEEKLTAAAASDIYLLGRADSLPVENFEDATDPYLEGYIQALVDMHYYEQQVLVSVKDHKVTLSNLPDNALLYNSIIAFVKDVPGVKSVEVKKELSKEEAASRAKYIENPRTSGVWFPQSTVLFLPLVASPREITYSIAYRGSDRVVGNVAAAVSIGDEFPLYRWRNVLWGKGDLQIGIQGCIWAVFNYQNVPRHDNNSSCELINTDYFLGIPLSYAYDRWSFRFRLYHISSHLGDELIVDHPVFLHKRKNPSFEAIDLFTSYQFNRHLRGYFGPGVIIHSDTSFPMKTFYFEYGLELRIFGTKLDYHRLYGTPFLAAHFTNWQVRNWGMDSTFKLGYELSKMQGVGRKMRVYADYHTGYSYEGQFFKRPVDYWEAGLSWGW